MTIKEKQYFEFNLSEEKTPIQKLGKREVQTKNPGNLNKNLESIHINLSNELLSS
jgi:hypothetical protein